MSYANRKYTHKNACNNENDRNYNYKIYKTIRDNGGWDNWRMVCIHQQEVDNKRHGEQIEEDYRVELNGNMNMRRSFLSPEQKKEDKKEWDKNNKEYRKEYRKEWYENNKEHVKEYCKNNKEHAKEYYETNKESIAEKQKEYYKNNKDKIDERQCEVIICECGFSYTRQNKARHMKSQKHIKLMENI